jgi:SAM-dependent methyltransferase
VDIKNLYYPESRFGGFSDVDGTIAFYTRVNALLKSEYTVVDVGCGRGQYQDDPVPVRKNLRIFKGKCKKIIGIDVDKEAKDNPYLDEFHLIENGHWPIADGVADLCVCSSVLEHIEDPDTFFSECQRVLKPGGYFCARTPNLFSYLGLASKLIANRWHKHLLCRSLNDRKEEDVFPTLHRCNTKRKLLKLLKDNNFSSCVYGYEAEPSYFSFSKYLYYLAFQLQKITPKCLSITLFIFAKKNPNIPSQAT